MEKRSTLSTSAVCAKCETFGCFDGLNRGLASHRSPRAVRARTWIYPQRPSSPGGSQFRLLSSAKRSLPAVVCVRSRCRSRRGLFINCRRHEMVRGALSLSHACSPCRPEIRVRCAATGEGLSSSASARWGIVKVFHCVSA